MCNNYTYYSANLRNKALINHILLETLSITKSKNKKVSELNLTLWPTLLFISMFVCNNFFHFAEKFLQQWKSVFRFIQNSSLSPGLNSCLDSSMCCKSHVLTVRSCPHLREKSKKFLQSRFFFSSLSWCLKKLLIYLTKIIHYLLFNSKRSAFSSFSR